MLTIPIAKARSFASIICVEADPDIHRILQENLKQNGCTRVRTICCVVSNIDHQLIPFYRTPRESFGMGSIGPQFNVTPVMLKQMSVDTLLGNMNIDRVDVIKIDVEGAEACVLQGGAKVAEIETVTGCGF